MVCPVGLYHHVRSKQDIHITIDKNLLYGDQPKYQSLSQEYSRTPPWAATLVTAMAERAARVENESILGLEVSSFDFCFEVGKRVAAGFIPFCIQEQVHGT